jgi:hypothetical protein
MSEQSEHEGGAGPKLASNRSPSWAFMQKFEVPDYDRPERNYLTRWRLVQTPWFGIYLHRFDGPDPRSTLHDHPWSFTSLVLRGGYIEADCYSGSRTKPVGDDWGLPEESLVVHGGWTRLEARAVNRKRAGDCHTIVKLLRIPTWTLMLVGRRTREWGYVDPDGTWTRFDLHRHNDEFVAALATRNPDA